MATGLRRLLILLILLFNMIFTIVIAFIAYDQAVGEKNYINLMPPLPPEAYEHVNQIRINRFHTNVLYSCLLVGVIFIFDSIIFNKMSVKKSLLKSVVISLCCGLIVIGIGEIGLQHMYIVW